MHGQWATSIPNVATDNGKRQFEGGYHFALPVMTEAVFAHNFFTLKYFLDFHFLQCFFFGFPYGKIRHDTTRRYINIYIIVYLFISSDMPAIFICNLVNIFFDMKKKLDLLTLLMGLANPNLVMFNRKINPTQQARLLTLQI